MISQSRSLDDLDHDAGAAAASSHEMLALPQDKDASKRNLHNGTSPYMPNAVTVPIHGSPSQQSDKGRAWSHARRASLLDAFTDSWFHPYSTFFLDVELETRFRQYLFRESKSVVQKLFVAVTLLFGIAIAADYHFYYNEPEAMRVKLPLWIGAAGIMLLTMIFGLLRDTSERSAVRSAHTLSFGVYCVALTISGCLWAAYTVVENDNRNLQTKSAGVISFLLIVHVLGRMAFPFALICTWSVTASHVATSWIFQDGNDPWVRVVEQLCFVILANIVLSYASYTSEVSRRRAFLARHRVQQERDVLQEETRALRTDFFEMVLRKYDIATFDDLDFKSPLEKAMVILRELVNEPASLSPTVLSELTKVVQFLTRSDVFKPQIEEQLNRKPLADDETEAWLLGLIDDTLAPARGNRTTVYGSNAAVPLPAASSVQTLRSVSEESQSSDPGDQPHAPVAPRTPSNRGSMRLPPGSLLDSEAKTVTSVLEQLEDWNFDVFEVHKITSGRPLLFVGWALFKKYDLLARFKVPSQVLVNFLTTVEKGYRDNPYHNSTHAADVVQTVHFFMSRSGQFGGQTTQIEVMAALVASAIHDYDHPGRTNLFHINARHPLAILYNDRSVLENHHCAAAFAAMLAPETNITAGMQDQEFVDFRRIVVEMVLATDLQHHFEFLNQFNAAVKNGVDVKSARDRSLLLRMTLKVADVSHTSKNAQLHFAWTERIMREFKSQGDEERARGLPLSPFMDPQGATVAKSQIGFMNYLVKPMYESWMQFLQLEEETTPCLRQLLRNRDHWVSELARFEEETSSATRPPSRELSAGTANQSAAGTPRLSNANFSTPANPATAHSASSVRTEAPAGT